MDEDDVDARPGIGFGSVASRDPNGSGGALHFVPASSGTAAVSRDADVSGGALKFVPSSSGAAALPGVSRDADGSGAALQFVPAGSGTEALSVASRDADGSALSVVSRDADGSGSALQFVPASSAAALPKEKPHVEEDMGNAGSDGAAEDSAASDESGAVSADTSNTTRAGEVAGDGVASNVAATAGASTVSGNCEASSSVGAEAPCSAETALSPLEMERRKLLAFEEKLKQLEGQSESLNTNMQQQPAAQMQPAAQLAKNRHSADEMSIEEANSRSVCVFGLAGSCTPDDLQELFKASGPINRVTIVVDKMTGMPKGFAYIEFKDTQGVQNALLLNGTIFREYPLKVTQKLSNIKGKSHDKGKGKDKGSGWMHAKGKALDKGKGKGKGKSKFYGNMVYRPNNAAGPY